MPLVENNDVIEKLSAKAADHAFNIGILPERDRSRLDKEQGAAPLRPQRREKGPEQPIRRRDAWSLPLQPIRRELMTQGGNFQLQ